MFFLDLQTLRAGDEGWLVLDVTAASDRWLLNRNKDLGLRLCVETEDGEAQCLSGSCLWAPGGSNRGLATVQSGLTGAMCPAFLVCAHYEDSVSGKREVPSGDCFLLWVYRASELLRESPWSCPEKGASPYAAA